MSTVGKRQLLTCAIVAFAMIGILVSGTLLADHDGGWDTGHNLGTAFLLQLCSSHALPSASCADVVASRWGSFDVYLGARRLLVPMSFIGLAYFLTVAVWFTFCGVPLIDAKWRRVGVGLFLVGGLLVSMALTIVMAFSLESWCPLCVFAHLANLAIFVAFVLAWRLKQAETSKQTATATVGSRNPDLRLSALALITSITVIASAWFYFDTVLEARRQWRQAHGLKLAIEALQDNTAFTMREFFAEPVQSVPRQEPASEDARPTMVVFRSFESDASACFTQDWRDEFSQKVGDSLRIEYRHTPLGLIRAVAEGRPPGDNETAPLRAMEAARLQHNPAAYDRLAVALFRSRKSHTQPDFVTLANRVGLDAVRLANDMSSEAVRRRVTEDLMLAASLHVDHTPAIFIEGRRVPNLCVKSSAFWSAIGHEPGLTESLATLGRTWVDEVESNHLAATGSPK